MTTILPMRAEAQHPLDLVGVGIGPFNLSLAALLDAARTVRARFFDKKSAFAWHPGLLFPDSILQTSFLKDLVTPVQPTSPHSFLAYLVEKKRFYDFMAGRFDGVSRVEFNDYMAWVAARLPSLTWGQGVAAARLRGTALELELDGGDTVLCRNLVIGTGMRPVVPDWAAAQLGSVCFMAGNYLTEKPSVAGKRVVVVGGGQTGAEITLDLMKRSDGPAGISWISLLPRFSPLEEGGFVDQVFTPDYVQGYRTLPQAGQSQEVASQKLASDGLTPQTVDAIYSEIYRQRHLCGGAGKTVRLLPGREVFDVRQQNEGSTVLTRAKVNGVVEAFSADVVILATGSKPCLPDFMSELRGRLDLDDTGLPKLDENYKMAWDGPPSIGLYGMNLGLKSHGIADPQMSLMAWRSATIANAVAGEEMFDLSSSGGLVEWPVSPQPAETKSAVSA
ncbi:SidA/IucD/PvdA family monooxygenase [Pseudovibrio exalbescens]|uniref:lysine N(6)-hydroxylase/L-ornithine N(5)-oxygenase family protein n=1 Tax=Pseudovibrio exalbescens TaxID=197461 RepID=UPI0023651FB6|nr:SidA/IucD/PvdA family monooxygenase [Pseudovibrio exalbescens]MDD7912007.1 SidA/IucD/PvdA family monooxygenase [Pseudovibrio exalbescens]